MKKHLYFISCSLLSFIFILASIFLVANYEKFYYNQYEKNNTTAYTCMSSEDLEKATVLLIEYLNDDRDDLILEVTKGDTVTNIFDDKEILHMVDVKVLYQNFYHILAISIVAFLVMVGYLWHYDKPNFTHKMLLNYKKALIFVAVLIATLGLVFNFNFNWFWTNFHHVFFNNDLWLLSPAVSTMINMFPLEFFYAICIRIVCMILAFSILQFVLFKFLDRNYKER